MRRPSWRLDLLVGLVLGGIAGAIAAVNFVIYTGVEEGYQADIGDVFEHNLLVGLVTVAILIGGPVLGIVLASRQRKRHPVWADGRGDPPPGSGRDAHVKPTRPRAPPN